MGGKLPQKIIAFGQSITIGHFGLKLRHYESPVFPRGLRWNDGYSSKKPIIDIRNRHKTESYSHPHSLSPQSAFLSTAQSACLQGVEAMIKKCK